MKRRGSSTMGGKYALRGGLPSKFKFNLTKSKLKIVVFMSLVLVAFTWSNSAWFGGTAIPSGHSGDHDSGSIVAREAELFSSYMLQHEDSADVLDGQGQGGGLRGPLNSKTELSKDNATEETSERPTREQSYEQLKDDDKGEEIVEPQTLKDDDKEEEIVERQTLKDDAKEEIVERQTLKDDAKEEIVEPQTLKDDAKEEIVEPQTLKDDAKEEIVERQTLKDDAKEEIIEPQTLKDDAKEEIIEPQTLKDDAKEEIIERQTLKQKVAGVPERDEAGNRRSTVNMLQMQMFEEIRAQSLDYTAIRTRNAREARDASCEGKYIYLYDLPSEFNVDLASQCDTLFPSFSLCDFLADSGTGTPVNNTKANGSQIFVPADRWFNTHQYALELISHARIKRYRCLTANPDQASLFYIPFYAGLDVIRWNFASDSTNEKRDALSFKLLRWLEKRPSWTRRGGRDHVLVLGKISWDFRRRVDGDAWGSQLLELPETENVTKVLIERNPWAKNDIGVPHPTFFHPQSAADIDTWLNHIRSQRRTSLVAFVGKERPGTTNVRSQLVQQCRNASTPSCRFVECVKNHCQVPAFVTESLLTTYFCMQPVGDSPTRRSVFDSLIAGCIPVLFHPCTAYVQYPWHLPRNETSWSVYISEDEVKRGEANVISILKKISVQERDNMRATIVDIIIPGLLYSALGSNVFPYRDAFDITIEQLLHRVTKIDDAL